MVFSVEVVRDVLVWVNSRVDGERREMEKGELQVSARIESVAAFALAVAVK